MRSSEGAAGASGPRSGGVMPRRVVATAVVMATNGSPAPAGMWRDDWQSSPATNRLKQRMVLWRSVALALAVLGAVAAARGLGDGNLRRRQGRIDMDLMRQAVEQVRATGLGRRGLSADRVEDLQRRVLYGQEWRVTIQSASCVVDE